MLRRSERGLSGVVALFFIIGGAFSFFLGLSGNAGGAEVSLIKHELSVSIDPAEGRLTATDTVTVPESFPTEFSFYLHTGLDPAMLTHGVPLAKEEAAQSQRIYDIYRVKLPAGVRTFTVRYGGVIQHPVRPVGREYARGFSSTPGTISGEGIYLAGSSFWYPLVEGAFVSFSLTVALPPGWTAVSQGGRAMKGEEKDSWAVRWESPEPQDEIHLVGGRFSEYRRPFRSGRGETEAMVFLRTPARELAEKYLEATARYVTMYEGLVGPYPYAKFALVENFWETGFGMPSFTLLGPKVVRFPFIIVSSYPHEILHNWWGNSVYPAYRSGNWSEGLTAYLSDHLIKEQQGAGAEYRLTTLQKYADYVLTERDFPLTGFTGRHSSPSEAIGYGKALMFFHMLRMGLGDEKFKAGLQEFYRANRFRTASYDDLRESFEKVSGRVLGAEFAQWVARTGAPEIRIGNARAEKAGSGYLLRFLLEQVQPGASYLLRIPVAITLEGRKEARQEVVTVSSDKTEISLSLPTRPLRVDADPELDLFRRLDRGETPPALSQALGSRRMLAILPSEAKEDLIGAYRGLAGLLQGSGPDVVEVKLDTEVEILPDDRAVAVLGWENRFLKAITSSLSGYEVAVGDGAVRIGKTGVPVSGHSVVLSSRQPGMKDLPLVFIAADRAAALPGLGRKLPHYHRYSYLVFEGDDPENVVKGRWPVTDSPLTVFVPDNTGALRKAERGSLATRQPLAQIPPVFSEERMMEVTRFLSSDALGGRGFGSPGLDRAAEYIAAQFRDSGLEPAGDGGEGFFQIWQAEGGEEKKPATLRNVIGVIPGTAGALAGQSVVVGAHYDHLGLGWPDVRGENKGRIHPGADDNASGVAVLIELARAMVKGPKPERSVVFVAFAGEEAGKLGSRHYVSRQHRYPAEKAIGMVNLDTVGRLGRQKLLALGVQSAREWVHILRGAGFVTGLEIEAVTEELDSSDQVSFREAGVPAIQLFTGPQPDYHRPTDTADKIDRDGMAKVAAVAKEIVEYLAGRQEPLTTAERSATGEPAGGQRKSTLGTIPDFTHTGKGARLSGVMPGSPAEKAGLRAGDVIVRVNESPVNGLRDLSEILKTLDPGSRVKVLVTREGKEVSLEAVLQEK